MTRVLVPVLTVALIIFFMVPPDHLMTASDVMSLLFIGLMAYCGVRIGQSFYDWIKPYENHPG